MRCAGHCRLLGPQLLIPHSWYSAPYSCPQVPLRSLHLNTLPAAFLPDPLSFPDHLGRCSCKKAEALTRASGPMATAQLQYSSYQTASRWSTTSSSSMALIPCQWTLPCPHGQSSKEFLAHSRCSGVDHRIMDKERRFIIKRDTLSDNSWETSHGMSHRAHRDSSKAY